MLIYQTTAAVSWTLELTQDKDESLVHPAKVRMREAA